MTDVLTTHDLGKSYDRMRALAGLSLSVSAGQVFGLLGPNGSGKTTALGIVLGSTLADRGTVRWFGAANSARERRRVGALLEQPTFYPWLTGAANLGVVAAAKRLPADAATKPLETVGLWDARNQPFQSYSLGMKQRLGIAAALLGRPEVLVLDEPTNGVDAHGIFEIRSLITGFARAGGTVILASHMLDEVERVCTHLAILKKGTVVTSGKVADVLAARSWIELAAESLDGLAEALASLEPGARIERRESHIEVHAGRREPQDLNGALAARGIVLSLLARRQSSLESQYLALVGNGDAP